MASRPAPFSDPAGPVRDSAAGARLFDRIAWSADREAVAVALLDTQLRPIRTELLGEGWGTATPLFTRRLLALVLASEARALLLAHNHPSGDPEPSSADRRATAALAGLLRAIDVVLMDHLIVTPGGSVSMRDRGLV